GQIVREYMSDGTVKYEVVSRIPESRVKNESSELENPLPNPFIHEGGTWYIPPEHAKEHSKAVKDIYKGAGGATVDLGKDFIKGGISLGYNLAALGNYLYHSSGPEQVLRDTQSVLSKTPIFLQNFKNELQDTYDKQVTHGDTESQAHYFTYLGGTIASLFASSATKAGSIGGKASKLEKGANISKKAASKIKKVKKPLVPQMQVAGIPINVFSFEGLQKAAIQFIKKVEDAYNGA
ncbi:hypothetical protein PJ311_19205, partial [Bacillus sp. CLL-7-23]|nr:hypothetical protein [Bacillus changyiensis]